MWKTRIIRTIRILSFTIIFILLFNTFQNILNRKPEEHSDEFDAVFYEQLDKDYADVLFFGPSHTLVSVSPSTIFAENGISSWLFASSSQPIFSSYHKLKELLEDGYTPELVYIDTVTLKYKDYSPDFIENAYRRGAYLLHGLDNKLEYLWNLEKAYSNTFFDFTFPLFRFHDRWRVLEETDFAKDGLDEDFEIWTMGTRFVDRTVPIAESIIDYTHNNTMDLNAVEVEYLEKTKQLCDEYGIEMVALKLPDGETANTFNNSLVKLCNEIDVEFLNLNLDEHKSVLKNEYGLNYDRHFYDEKHLNVKGSVAVSRYLAKHMHDNYNLDNHSDDSSYAFINEYHSILKDTYPDAFIVPSKTQTQNQLDTSLYDKQNLEFVDALFFGASHSVVSISPSTIYDKNGISSWLYASSSQPIFTSYHKLSELIEDGYAPKVVVCDTLTMKYEDYSPNFVEYAYQNGLNIIHNTDNKIEYLKNIEREFENYPLFGFTVSNLSDEEQIAKVEAIDYKNILKEEKLPTWTMGTRFVSTVTPISSSFIDELSTDTMELNTVESKYFIMMAELCKENNIEFLALKLPDALTTTEFHNSLNNLCTENAIDFLDMNIDENTNILIDKYSLDFSNDFYDEKHLNVYGCIKTSLFLSDYLLNNYELQDHKDDNHYYFIKEYHTTLKETYPDAF